MSGGTINTEFVKYLCSLQLLLSRRDVLNIWCGRLHNSVISMSGLNFSSAVWHSATVLANIFHTSILVNIPELLGKPNGKVLLAMALTDIYVSSDKVVDGIIQLTGNQATTGNLYLDALWAACSISSYHTRFYVTAFGCFDRYMALCHPFKYDLNRVVRNIGKLTIGLSLLLHLLSWGLYVAKEEVMDSNIQPAFDPINNLDRNTSFLINVTQHSQNGLEKIQDKQRGSLGLEVRWGKSGRGSGVYNARGETGGGRGVGTGRGQTGGGRGVGTGGGQNGGGRGTGNRGGRTGKGNRTGNGNSSSSSRPNRTKSGMKSGSASSSGGKNNPIRLTIRILLYDFQLIPAFCVMLVSMPLTIKELLAMRKKSAANPGGYDRELAMAAIYILIITLISLMCLIPLYVIRHAKNSVPRSVSQPLRFLHDGYGMLNIVIYGIMNKKYRDTFRLLRTKINARCRCGHNSKVGPPNECQTNP